MNQHLIFIISIGNFALGFAFGYLFKRAYPVVVYIHEPTDAEKEAEPQEKPRRRPF